MSSAADWIVSPAGVVQRPRALMPRIAVRPSHCETAGARFHIPAEVGPRGIVWAAREVIWPALGARRIAA